MLSYPASYTGKNGSFETAILSDGESMSVKINGLTFEGTNFSFLEPQQAELAKLAGFSLNKRNELTDFSLKVAFQIKIRDKGVLRDCKLSCRIDVADELIKISDICLYISEEEVRLKGAGDFEYLIISLQQACPTDVEIESCLSCRYSHYWHAGNNEYGDLMCLKAVKAENSCISDKGTYSSTISKLKEKGVPIPAVQETFYCDEFQKITLGDWNYKDWNYSFFKAK